MDIKRHMKEQIRKASASYPVVMVCGQRQVGKSTMLYHIRESAEALLLTYSILYFMLGAKEVFHDCD